MAKPDAVHRLTLVLELEGQVFFANQALRHHFQLFAEGGRRKALAPNFAVQGVDQVGAAVLGGQRAVGFQPARQGGGVQPCLLYTSDAADE